MHFLIHLAQTAGIVAAALLLSAGLLHLVGRLGAGSRLSAILCRAPMLDIIVFYFIAGPLIAGPIVFGWAGLVGALVGQVAGVLLWIFLHEAANRPAVRGPRIVKVLNAIVGRWRNHAALWVTAIVAPFFVMVRLVEIISYPPLIFLVGLPRYKQGEWVNVSRQKFSGLVGHDLIWCLYCDWMTGIWSLGSEMLRNVESFWCPIRFIDAKKCANCSVDFPDVTRGWVEPDGTMAQAAEVANAMHSNGFHGWFGHPVRLTVKGESVPVGNGPPAGA
jgi:hypothetical protein